MKPDDETVSWLEELANASARAAGVPEPIPAPPVETSLAADDPWAAAREQVRSELAAQKIKQRDIAVMLGVTEKHISQVLTGQADAPTMLARIAAQLGLTFQLATTADADADPFSFDRIGTDIAAALAVREPDRYDQALAAGLAEAPSTGGCPGDPIECGYAAALGEAEEKLRQAEAALARKTDLSAVYGYELGENEAGRNVEAWLKTQRDRSAKNTPRWTVIDDLLDDYRLHNQTGTPLDQHVCDGGCLPGRETCPADDDEEEVAAP